MNEDNLAKQEESVRKQEAMKRGNFLLCAIITHLSSAWADFWQLLITVLISKM